MSKNDLCGYDTLADIVRVSCPSCVCSFHLTWFYGEMVVNAGFPKILPKIARDPHFLLHFYNLWCFLLLKSYYFSCYPVSHLNGGTTCQCEQLGLRSWHFLGTLQYITVTYIILHFAATLHIIYSGLAVVAVTEAASWWSYQLLNAISTDLAEKQNTNLNQLTSSNSYLVHSRLCHSRGSPLCQV